MNAILVNILKEFHSATQTIVYDDHELLIEHINFS